MASVGKIYPSLTHIEIDEDGTIWQIINNTGHTVIEDLNAASHGQVAIDEMPDDFFDDEDPFRNLWIR